MTVRYRFEIEAELPDGSGPEWAERWLVRQLEDGPDPEPFRVYDVRPVIPRREPRCTPTSARWCPVCGDCVCGKGPDGERDEFADLDDERCPLHSSKSAHAEGA